MKGYYNKINRTCVNKPLGGPKTRWEDIIKTYMKLLGESLKNKEKAMDRENKCEMVWSLKA